MVRRSFENSKVWITGHRGMVGSALVRGFADERADLLLTSRQDLDLADRAAVLDWMDRQRPELVFHVAARVGGIQANARMPADFLRDNLLIQANVIEGAQRAGVAKLVFVASNCIYPQHAAQPIAEDQMLTGMVEENIRAYAIGKIAGIETCRAFNRQYGCDFVSVVPPNLYGPGDNYDPQDSHVVAGILRRAHEAKVAGAPELAVWGDGTARRELLHVDDLASALKYVMLSASDHDLYNVGCGHDLTIGEIAGIIADVVGFRGRIVFDTSRPNGTMRKLLDHRRVAALGWRPAIAERAGLAAAYADFMQTLKRREIRGG